VESGHESYIPGHPSHINYWFWTCITDWSGFGWL